MCGSSGKAATMLTRRRSFLSGHHASLPVKGCRSRALCDKRLPALVQPGLNGLLERLFILDTNLLPESHLAVENQEKRDKQEQAEGAQQHASEITGIGKQGPSQ